jgi:hypothetical protein
MAETIGLEVLLAMDADQLQLELQKAENQLKKFESQLKKSTDTTQIANLQRSIANVNGTLTNIGTVMGNTAKKTGDATQSIVNLSRVAQDAPYGFIGIANNINPLLESFQRLQKESNGTKGALASIVSGLTGPAGIGLAVGVVSSLLVSYSKEIANFFASPTEKLKTFREELGKLNQDIYKIVGEAQANRAIGLNLVNVITGGDPKKAETALAKLKELYKDNADIQNAKIGNDKKFYTHLVNMASIQEAATGKEKNSAEQLKLAYAEYKKLEAERNAALKGAESLGATFGFSKKSNVETEKAAINLKYDKLLEPVKQQIERAKGLNAQFVDAITDFREVDKNKPKPNNEFANAIQNEIKAIELEAFKAKQMRDKLKDINNPFLMEKPEDKAKAEKQRLAGIKAFGESKMTGDLGKSLQGATSTFYEETLKDNQARTASIQLTKQQTEANLQLADTLSNYASDAFMNLWASMEQGMSIGEALGNLFIDLAKQIAAAAIKAAVFQAILAAVSGGGSAAATATSGGFMNLFKGFLGLASGGIVTKPTLAMVGEGNESEAVMPLSKLSGFLTSSFNAGAMSSTGSNGGQFVLKGSDLVLALQRSNNNLNLRRGV